MELHIHIPYPLLKFHISFHQYTESKSYAEDLTEGKFNFPCIHAIQSRPEDTRVINIIRQRTTDVEVSA